MTLSSPGVVGFNPETMESCVLADLDSGVGANSFGVVRDTIVGCSSFSDQAFRVDVRTGVIDAAPVEMCLAITDANDVLYVLNDFDGLKKAETFEDLAAGNLTQTGMNPRVESLAARGNDLYAAWHSTNEIEHWDIPTKTQLPNITLEDFDHWVMGIAPLEDGRILILSWDELVGFSSTGERLFSNPPGFVRESLRCYVN